jgi:tRNA (cmo5U34)-methyltransferase
MANFSSNNFDLVSPIYDALATLVFGGNIRRSQVALLPKIKDANSALVIGGGTGWFLLELLARTDVRKVLYVELSKDMLDKSQRLVERRAPQWLSRVEFRLGSEESITPADGPFDLIATNFFLACFGDDNCSQMISRLHPHMAPNGRWLFADFQVPDRGWRRVCAMILFKVMFTFFNVFSGLEARRPPNYDLGFRQVGLKPQTERRFYARMIHVKLMANAQLTAR